MANSSPEFGGLPKLDFPWFAVPHDGTQPEIDSTERGLVAQKFNSLVGDLQLNYISGITHTKTGNRLFLTLPVNETNAWLIAVISRDLHTTREETIEPQKSIVIQHVEKNKGDHERVIYYKEIDEIVKRRIIDPRINIARKAINDLEPKGDISPDEWKARFYKIKKILDNTIANRRLEQSMGYNDQPVGMSEINSVSEFLLQPDITLS